MDIWTILNIAPTEDLALIRRTYAHQLKLHRPDRDPKGYQQLREAFEQAKTLAAQPNLSLIPLDISEKKIKQPIVNSVELEICGSNCAGTPWLHVPVSPMPYTLDDVAQVAKDVVHNEMVGLPALDRLWTQITRNGNLEQQQQFHQHFAMALANQPGIIEGDIETVSKRLGWGWEKNNTYPMLQPFVVQAIETQMRQTELARVWKRIQVDSESASCSVRLANQLLLSERQSLPFWTRLTPNLVADMHKQASFFKYKYPELVTRLNPVIFNFVLQPRLALNWSGLFLFAFWGSLLLCILPHAKLSKGSTFLVGLVVVYYLYGCNIAQISLMRRPRLLNAYLLIEYLISVVAALIFFGTLFWLVIKMTTPLGRSAPYTSMIGCFFIIVFFRLSWPRHMPKICRPGGLLNQVFSSPWRLIKSLKFSIKGWVSEFVFYIICACVTHELLELLP
ncbi:hypothetical protein [Sodalis sp. RH23]|uniref:hypothetical protein n=1 Tax=unclassified Sodalis (in: enterobacteria) TaxID=2636512 RepID=UPI0039B62331